MRTLRINQNGQLTIPADMRKALGITQETDIDVALSNNGEIKLTPKIKKRKTPLKELHKKYQLTMTAEEFEQMVNDSRSEV